MSDPFRLVWSRRSLADLEHLSERSSGQTEAVVNAMEWLAASGFSLGAEVASKASYWPVPPLGVYYRVRGGELIVIRITDVRRRRRPNP